MFGIVYYSYQIAQCVHRQTQTIVSDDHCGHEYKPDKKKKTCNDTCTLRYLFIFDFIIFVIY